MITTPRQLIAALTFALALNAGMAQAQSAPFVVPTHAMIPDGPEGDAIKMGESLIAETKKLLPKNVGNGLNCTSCHLGNGTVPFAGPYVGLWGMFPEFRGRSGSINSLNQRINDCFERSMNGKAIALDSKEMNAMLMYMRWLSNGVPTGTPVEGRGMGKVDTNLNPNPMHGNLVYAAKCASCHAANGLGMKNSGGGYAMPPLWGKDSFNIGAGMARTYTAAAFIKHNMPYGQGNTLTDQEAIDVAAYMTHQPRPAYAPAKKDYAKGVKPKDARN